MNAALSMEMLFKSYLCEEIAINKGFNYKFDPKVLNKEYKESNIRAGHDLFLLAKSLPKEIQFLLFQDSDFELIKKRRDTFVSSRYLYESKNKVSSDGILLHLVSGYIEKTINLYKERECDDWWINHYPEI
ncbi:hypothetical protein ACRRS0_20245 [Agarivorans sp. QJM3NY_29]|uniref:hypothetical protein n=1 Tax=unclassified Agarivorans TaxID=2636026 RepID=UPI003D7E04AD